MFQTYIKATSTFLWPEHRVRVREDWRMVQGQITKDLECYGEPLNDFKMGRRSSSMV